ncbi:hypothetical protein L218DRAFT_940402 [Marasmius fiardii PR-910]|nr:hypothetical protein L218DRAFT_940402 [Marasmius fiardii PR-910]
MLDHFDIVSLNLQLIGAISVEEYLNNSNHETLPVNYDVDLNFHANEDPVRKTGDRNLNVQDGSVSIAVNKPPQKDPEADDSLELLTSRCSASFPGNVIENILKWQFEEDSILILGNVHKTWRAKLTIMKPTGESMSIHSSQSMEVATAQIDAAKKAIKSGALDFMSPSDNQTSQVTLPTLPLLQEKPRSVETDQSSPTESVHHDVFSKPLEGADLRKQRSKEYSRRKRREKRAAALVMDSESEDGATPPILPHASLQGGVPPTTPASSPVAIPLAPSVLPPTIFQAPALPNPLSQRHTGPETTSAIQQVESIFAANKRQNSILRWYQHTEKSQEKSQDKCGFALLVKLSNTLHRVYSTPSTFSDAEFAKEQCAEIALEEGFSEFMHSQPSTQLPYSTMIDDLGNTIDLQQFYASLGNSFREAWGNKSVHELGALQWLNTAVVGARGSQLVSSFHIIRRNQNGGTLAGALLRLERPNETISYLIEPRFRREKDAKLAVCLHAMALGVGDYLRKVESEMYSRIPTQRMKTFSRKVSQMIPEHLKKMVFTVERGAWGGTLSLTSNLPLNLGGTQEYKVPYEYRNKPDAEAALLCFAVQRGCIEFLQFGNCSIPSEYSPILAQEASEVLEEHKTRVTERGQGEVEPGEVVSGVSIPNGTQAKTPTPVSNNTHVSYSGGLGTIRRTGSSNSSSVSTSMSIPSISQGPSTVTSHSPFPLPLRVNNAAVPPFPSSPYTHSKFPPRRQLATRGGAKAAATTVPATTFDSTSTTPGHVQPLNHAQTREEMPRSSVERSKLANAPPQDTRKRPLGSEGLDILNSTGVKRKKG